MDHNIATPNQLGLILKNIRNSRGLTQKKAAEKTGLLPKTVSLLENDPEKSSMESFLKYLSALDLELHLKEKDILAELAEGDEW